MKRSDKFALSLALVIGIIILVLGLFLDMGGAFQDTPTFHSGGWNSLGGLWIDLCLIFVLPIWLLLRGIGIIFAGPQQRDVPFIEPHSGR